MAKESTKWGLLIGVDLYHESLGSLKYAGADCRALRDTLVSGPLGFPDDQVLLLDDSADTEHRPTFANIHNTLGTWLAAPKEDDLVLVYLAGHGRLVDGKTYLVPGDATLSSIHTLGIPLPHVQDVLERCKARRKLLVLDACHSGSGRDVAAMPGDMATALAAGTGFYTISSCGAEERSHEWDEVGHGVFSHFLTEALRGGCSPVADGRLTVDRVYEWVHERVAKWAAQHRCAQTPQRFAQGAGTLVISQSAPDYAALAEQYRREAEEAKARLADAELRKTREQVELDDVASRKQELQAEARRFTQANPNLNGAALQARWRKTARRLPHSEVVPDADLAAMILDPYGRRIAGVSQAADTNADNTASLRVVAVPPDIDVRIYVDDEFVQQNRNTIQLSEGTHTIRVVPKSMEWGVDKSTLFISGEVNIKQVVRLKRALSRQAIASFLASILVGCVVSGGMTVLPLTEATTIRTENGAESPVYVLLGMFAVHIAALLYGWLIGGVISLIRGLTFNMSPFKFDISWELDPPHGLLGLLAISCAYIGWGMGFVLPIRYVFMASALGTAVLAGILFCIVPWHGHYRDRDVT
jgi:uncharacterized caspase-like protein